MGGVGQAAAIIGATMGANRLMTAPQKHNDFSSILVENLEGHVVDKTLYESFTQFGRIEFCQILRLPTGKSQGQAYVCYASVAEAQAAVAHVEGTGPRHAAGVTTSAGNFILPGCAKPVKCKHVPYTKIQLEMQTQPMKQYRYIPS